MMNFISQAKGLTRNPLGIIALFISLIYGFACLVLSTSVSNLEDSSERLPLIWFIIIFPLIILVGFLFLVTKHHGKLYSPSDYGNVESFLKTLEGARKFETASVDINVGDSMDTSGVISSLVEKVEDLNLNKGVFSIQTRKNVEMANDFFADFLERVGNKSYAKSLGSIHLGAQAPEYFLFGFSFKKENLIDKNTISKEEIIIRITEDNNGVLNMIAIGKDIIEKDPIHFSDRIVEYIDKLAKQRLKQ